MNDMVIAAVMMWALLAQQIGQQVQTTPQQQAGLPNGPVQQQQIPDAPKPQTTGLGPVAPGKATTRTSNGESGSLPGADPDQPEVGASLPPTAKAAPDEEQDAAPITSSQGLETIINTVNAVEIPFTVKDSKGRQVPGLDWREVHVYENNVRQKMTVFTVDPHPLTVALVLDQSMPFDTMARVNNALGALGGAFAAYDEVAVFTYNNHPKMMTDFTAGQSARLTATVERAKTAGREPIYFNSGEALSRGIDINNGAQDHINPLSSGGPGSPQGLSQQQVPRESHPLNDAILMAAQAASKAKPGRRRIVYVISDGKEYGSTAKTKDVIKYLQRNKIEVVATLVGDASVAGMGFIDTIHLPLMMRDNILPTYTKATGGQFYADYRTKGIETSFAKITEDVRTQYTVWYNSREPMIDGKYRKVEVRVLRPNLQVIAKDGYYPSVSDARPMVVPPKTVPPATNQ